MTNEKISVCWLRRDLRLDDNAALYHALRGPVRVLPLFIFDSNILDQLQDRQDARVQFIYNEIAALKSQLQALGSDLLVRHGKPIEVWKELLNTHQVAAVYTNHDFEPYAKERDAAVGEVLAANGIALHTYKDHVIFEKMRW